MIGDIIFIGTMRDFREFFNKRWCQKMNLDLNKWRYVGLSLMDDTMVTNIKTKAKYKMTSGTSGCNFMMVDSTGGHFSFLEHDKNKYEFYNKG